MAWIPHKWTKHTCQMLQQLEGQAPVLLRKGFRWIWTISSGRQLRTSSIPTQTGRMACSWAGHKNSWSLLSTRMYNLTVMVLFQGHTPTFSPFMLPHVTSHGSTYQLHPRPTMLNFDSTKPLHPKHNHFLSVLSVTNYFLPVPSMATPTALTPPLWLTHYSIILTYIIYPSFWQNYSSWCALTLKMEAASSSKMSETTLTINMSYHSRLLS